MLNMTSVLNRDYYLVVTEENEKTSLFDNLSELLRERNAQLIIAYGKKQAIKIISNFHEKGLTFCCIVGCKQSTKLASELKSKSPSSEYIHITTKGETKKDMIKALRHSDIDDYLIRQSINSNILFYKLINITKKKQDRIIYIDGLFIDPKKMIAIYEGEEIKLQERPFNVLYTLVQNYCEPVSKEILLYNLWDSTDLNRVNTLEVAVNKIRNLIDKKHGIKSIRTIRGYGYTLNLRKKH
jgi:two-component system copper resistance phosphate regulon response regulator CusR